MISPTPAQAPAQPFYRPFEAASAPLADALAHTLGDIARKKGVDVGACSILEKVTQALILAGENGAVCITLTQLGEPTTLRRELLATGLVGEAAHADPVQAGQAGTPNLPLILDSANRLYLHRYYEYESRLVDAVEQRIRNALPAAAKHSGTHGQAMRDLLDTLFPVTEAASPDWQKLAVALALQRRLTLISGGPGTGKTTTVVALLAVLLSEQPDLRIGLAAPTGKAATRLLEAMLQRSKALPASLAPLTQFLPREAFTLHRLLGSIPGTSRFRHDARHPLPLDVLIVDEASMLDLALASKLFNAVPTSARLILLGDKDQLASVEAGSVFHALSADPRLSQATAGYLENLTRIPATSFRAEVQSTAYGQGAPPDNTVWLTRSYRFSPSSAIGQLARAIRARGDSPAERVAPLNLQQAQDIGDSSVRWFDLNAGLDDAALARMEAAWQDFTHCLLGAAPASRRTPDDISSLARRALSAFEQHRVLCAVRHGPRGVDALNTALATRIQAHLEAPVGAHTAGLNPSRAGWHTRGQRRWFHGQPILIMRNTATLGLFNGDIGILLEDYSGHLLAWFTDGAGGMRPIAPQRLPEHELAFAMTVHKSQGSEFARVSCVLPQLDSPVLTRELLYTAVTRAREGVDLYGEPALFERALGRSGQRSSGLEERLRSHPGAVPDAPQLELFG